MLSTRIGSIQVAFVFCNHERNGIVKRVFHNSHLCRIIFLNNYAAKNVIEIQLNSEIRRFLRRLFKKH